MDQNIVSTPNLKVKVGTINGPVMIIMFMYTPVLIKRVSSVHGT